mgnify:CR=1 FL=1
MSSTHEWIVRGTALGSVLGILPGGGAVLAAFASYTLEKKIAADPSRFGKGAIEGVAGPEASNNASAGGALVPLLTLGIPTSATAAVLISATQIAHIKVNVRICREEKSGISTVIALTSPASSCADLRGGSRETWPSPS